MSKFEGFMPRQNQKDFTQLPNKVVDEVMYELSGAELKILLLVIRQTYGWVKEIINGQIVYKTKDYISLSQFQEKTGLSRKWITEKLKSLREKGYIIKVENYDYNNTDKKPADAYALKQIGGSEESTPGGSEESTPGGSEESTLTKDTITKYKTEEEEDAKIPQKIQQRFSQIFDRNLTVEFYQKIIEYYSDEKIILKVLELAEENAKVPKYILNTLKDWSDNNLTSLSRIKDYLDNRQAQKQYKRSRKETAAAKQETPEKELERLYQEGWQ